MRNLIPYNDNCFDVHQKAVANKNSGPTKTRLLSINPSIKVLYEQHNLCFNTNQLHNLSPDNTAAVYKNDLLTLYDYQSKIVRSVREHICSLQVRTIINTCQNCTIDSISTLDHYLPKSKFPEFIVNPHNLFPCCSTCNSLKASNSPNTKQNTFLNLYLDKLPKEQYLFVKLQINHGRIMDFTFYLNNINNAIDQDLFLTINSHFATLNLLNRMRLKSIEHLSELENLIDSLKQRLPLAEIIEILKDKIEEDKKAYGDNYYKAIFEMTCLNSEAFLSKYRNSSLLG